MQNTPCIPFTVRFLKLQSSNLISCRSARHECAGGEEGLNARDLAPRYRSSFRVVVDLDLSRPLKTSFQPVRWIIPLAWMNTRNGRFCRFTSKHARRQTKQTGRLAAARNAPGCPLSHLSIHFSLMPRRRVVRTNKAERTFNREQSSAINVEFDLIRSCCFCFYRMHLYSEMHFSLVHLNLDM